jgi:excisionase family DNA binding protein
MNYTVKEIATKLGVVPPTVKIWIREGKLKAKMEPRGYVINDKNLQTFIEKYKKGE